MKSPCCDLKDTGVVLWLQGLDFSVPGRLVKRVVYLVLSSLLNNLPLELSFCLFAVVVERVRVSVCILGAGKVVSVSSSFFFCLCVYLFFSQLIWPLFHCPFEIFSPAVFSIILLFFPAL